MLQRLPATTVIACCYLFGGAGVLAVSASHLRAIEPTTVPTVAWLGISYIVIVPTTIGYLVNIWAVSRSTPSLAATYTTLQPLAGGMLAFAFLGEHIGWPQIVGGLLILAGLQRVSTAHSR